MAINKPARHWHPGGRSTRRGAFDQAHSPCTKRSPNKFRVRTESLNERPGEWEGEVALMDAGIEIGKFDNDLLLVIEEVEPRFRTPSPQNKTTRNCSFDEYDRVVMWIEHLELTRLLSVLPHQQNSTEKFESHCERFAP